MWLWVNPSKALLIPTACNKVQAEEFESKKVQEVLCIPEHQQYYYITDPTVLIIKSLETHVEREVWQQHIDIVTDI